MLLGHCDPMKKLGHDTLHIKWDKEFKNTNLETKGYQKFNVLNQYRTLEITDRTINRKIVATIANNLLKYVLRTCIYRSMVVAVPVKMHYDQISTITKSQWQLLCWLLMLHVLRFHCYNDKQLIYVTLAMNICLFRDKTLSLSLLQRL